MSEKRRTGPRPHRRNQATFWVTEVPGKPVALITGTGSALAVLKDIGLDGRARWSKFGHGWVIPTEDVADFLAECQRLRILVRLRQEKS